MATQLEQIRDYLQALVGTAGIDDLDTLLTAIDDGIDDIVVSAAAIDANTDRNTDYEILTITLDDDNWHNVTFAQAVKKFKIQERGLSADIWFRKSAVATNYITIGSGDTMPFGLAMASATVGQVCRKTGAGTVYAAVLGKF